VENWEIFLPTSPVAFSDFASTMHSWIVLGFISNHRPSTCGVAQIACVCM
jgi:hypothetical protein